MFVVHDMLVEAVVVAVVLVAVLLSGVAIASAGRDWIERRRVRAEKARLRRGVWGEYAAACVPLRPQAVSAGRPPATPRAGSAARPVRLQTGVEGETGLSPRAAKA